jgi:hypothetical protein
VTFIFKHLMSIISNSFPATIRKENCEEKTIKRKWHMEEKAVSDQRKCTK